MLQEAPQKKDDELLLKEIDKGIGQINKGVGEMEGVLAGLREGMGELKKLKEESTKSHDPKKAA